MRSALLLVTGAICGIAIMAAPRVAAHLRVVLRNGQVGQGMAGNTRVHTEEGFSFIANAPMERVAPLFGAEGERVWAPHWDPEFVYPVPAADQEGMVFRVAHGHLKIGVGEHGVRREKWTDSVCLCDSRFDGHSDHATVDTRRQPNTCGGEIRADVTEPGSG